jgi:hypothetical protein
VAAGLAALGAYKYSNHVREERRKPIGVMPALPRAQEEKVREAVRQFGRTVLGVTPEQEKAIEAVWQEPPWSLGELIERQKKSDAILTPQQRAFIRPIRIMVRNTVIDGILEPGRDRFKPDDFEKFKYQVKLRVAQRMGE